MKKILVMLLIAQVLYARTSFACYETSCSTEVCDGQLVCVYYDLLGRIQDAYNDTNPSSCSDPYIPQTVGEDVSACELVEVLVCTPAACGARYQSQSAGCQTAAFSSSDGRACCKNTCTTQCCLQFVH